MEGKKKKSRKIAVDKREMAAGGGEKNVQEKKKNKGGTNDGKKEDMERFLETSWRRFGQDLSSSWGPVAKKLLTSLWRLLLRLSALMEFVHLTDLAIRSLTRETCPILLHSSLRLRKFATRSLFEDKLHTGALLDLLNSPVL